MSEITLTETVVMEWDKLGGSIPEILEQILSKAEQQLRNSKATMERTILEWAQKEGHDLLAVVDCIEWLVSHDFYHSDMEFTGLPRMIEETFKSYVGRYTAAEYAYETYKPLVENLPDHIKIDWDETYYAMPAEHFVYQGTHGHMFRIT